MALAGLDPGGRWLPPLSSPLASITRASASSTRFSRGPEAKRPSPQLVGGVAVAIAGTWCIRARIASRRLLRSSLLRRGAESSGGQSHIELRSPGESSESGYRVGHDTRIAEEGRKNLPPGVQLTQPTSMVGGGRPIGLPVAPSAHRDGYASASARGPRFRHLPPPPDRPYSHIAGPLQPALSSRLNAMEDVRLEGWGGEPWPPGADSVCLVPEPHIRAFRPDQLHRELSVAQRFESIFRTLERGRRWFNNEPTNVVGEQLAGFTDEQLRERCVDKNLPVSGDRQELERTLTQEEYFRRVLTELSMAKVEEQCYLMGLEVRATKVEMQKAILDYTTNKRFDRLTDDELRYECAFRGLDVVKGRTAMLALIHAWALQRSLYTKKRQTL